MDTASALMLGLWLWFGGWAVALSVVDLREHRLPNPMVGACLVGALSFVAAIAWAGGGWGLFLRSVAASAAAVLAFGVGHLLGGIGMGDVKYASVTGLALGAVGWSAVWWGHLLGFLLAGGVVVVGMATGRLHRRSALAFGPFMAAGAGTVGLAALTLPMAT